MPAGGQGMFSLDELPSSFATWVRAGMQARGLSGRQLAARSGVDHSTISRLLNSGRNPSYATARKLARALESNPASPTGVEAALRRDPALSEGDVAYLLTEYRRVRMRRLRRSAVGLRRV